MLRQRGRQREVKRMVEGTEAISPMYDMPTLFSSETLALDDHGYAVRKVCDGAERQGVGFGVVSDCLRVLALKSGTTSEPDLNFSAAHFFYHAARDRNPCLLKNSEERGNELAAMRQMPPFVDLVRQNMKDTYGLPIFVWDVECDRVFDLVMGRLRLYVQFDMNDFFALAAREGVKLKWETKDLDPRLQRLSGPIPGGPANAWGVRVELADGAYLNTVLAGFFRRAVTNLTPPHELIRLMKNRVEVPGSNR